MKAQECLRFRTAIKAGVLAAALALGACDQPQLAHPDHNTVYALSDGGIFHIGTPQAYVVSNSVYIDPRCLAHIDEVRAIGVPVREMPAGSFFLVSPDGQDRDGVYIGAGIKPAIQIRAGRFGWYREELVLHEKCHAYLHKTTGNPQFHR